MPDDDWRQNDPEFKQPRLDSNLKIVEKLTEIGNKHGFQPGVVAIAWTLRNPAVTAAIVGMRRPDQVVGIFPANQFRLSEAEIKELDQLIADKL